MASVTFSQPAMPMSEQQQQQQQGTPLSEQKTKSTISIETQHDDMIHDAQFDYYGTKLASCSSGKWSKKPNSCYCYFLEQHEKQIKNEFY
jgi:hypothetical protein